MINTMSEIKETLNLCSSTHQLLEIKKYINSLMKQASKGYNRISNLNKTIHYLKVLQSNSSIIQPEIRDAIRYAINRLSYLEYEETK